MIIATKSRGDMPLVGFSRKGAIDDWPWSTPPPLEWLLNGRLVTGDQAVGLPALLACLLFLADSASMLPSLIYRRTGKGYAEQAPGAPQWRLFTEQPNPDTSPGAFRADVVMALAAGGNAYVRKWKARGRVAQLEVLDRRFVRARRGAGGRTVFDDFTLTGSPGDSVTRDTRDIIHLRLGRLNASSAIAYSPEGMSPITAARIAVALGLKRQQWEASYFENDGRPGTVLVFPQGVSTDEAEDWVDLWDSQHAGAERAHGTAVLGGGADIKGVPVSLSDAQFVESKKFTLGEMGAIYKIPRSLLNDGDMRQPTSPDMDLKRFTTLGLGPYLTIMDEGFTRDPDLFPTGESGGPFFLDHDRDALLRPDISTRYTAYKDARQGSWITANEVRAKENLPPIAGGDEILVTPTGSAPNPGSTPDGADT